MAELYGVETKRVNEAVKNNPDKFPDSYVVILSSEDKSEPVENFDRFSRLNPIWFFANLDYKRY